MNLVSFLRRAGSFQAAVTPLLPRMTRRMAVMGAALGLIGTRGGAMPAEAQTVSAPERMLRPRKGDKLVFASGPNMGKTVGPEDLAEGGPQVLVWGADPVTGVVRDGSRLNQALVVRLPADSLNEVSRKRSASGVVAYSAICSHAQCPVTEWRKDLGRLHCPCHNSEYDPRENAKVVNGPAMRQLASLPLALEDGVLVVAEPFIGKVGAQA